MRSTAQVQVQKSPLAQAPPEDDKTPCKQSTYCVTDLTRFAPASVLLLADKLAHQVTPPQVDTGHTVTPFMI